MTKAEIYEMVGQDVLSRIEVINHAWNNPDVLITLGQTENGTWIDINKIVYEADLLVGLSSVKPHRVAGWSGGAKIIDPGVCGKRTINGTHYLSIQYSIEEIIGVLENPIQKEIRKIAKMTGLDFSINAVVNKNDEVVNIFAGDFILAHRRAAEFAATIFRDPQSEKADFMICGVGEWGPDFWSAAQSIFLANIYLKMEARLFSLPDAPKGYRLNIRKSRNLDINQFPKF